MKNITNILTIENLSDKTKIWELPKTLVYRGFLPILYLKYRFINQRRFLSLSEKINAGILVLVLEDYFPGLTFIQKQNPGNLSISNYIVQKNGRWTLDINAMSKSKEKRFACLFPKKINQWDEEKARSKYGNADLIRFFIDEENSCFLSGFLKQKKPSPVQSGNTYVTDNFLNGLEYNKGRPVWESWNFSNIVLHKMRHNPPSVYEAFGYYGHRLYALLNFALDNIMLVSDNPANDKTGELIKKGNKTAIDKVYENFPETKNYHIDKQTILFEIIQETLESVPSGSSIYTPVDIDTFIKQIRSRIINIHRVNFDDKYSGIYNQSDRKTINNHIGKLEKLSIGAKGLSDITKIKLSGTYRDKVNLLNEYVSNPEVRKEYSSRELETISSLFLKQNSIVSLDNELGGDDDNSFTGHDLVSEKKYLSPEDKIIWISMFKDEFKKELNRDNLEIFLECIPDHFKQYPFEIESDKKLIISRYSKKELFKTFCSVAGIPEDDVLWKPFLVLIQRVIDNINKEISHG